jgi:hypothetical protein
MNKLVNGEVIECSAEDNAQFAALAAATLAREAREDIELKHSGYKTLGFSFSAKSFSYDKIPLYTGAVVGMSMGFPVAPRSVQAIDGSWLNLATNDELTAFYATGFAHMDALVDAEQEELEGVS